MEIEQLLYEQPDSSELFLVYADHLQQQGDPLGELISLHYALSQTTDHDRLVGLRQAYEQASTRHASLLPKELSQHLELTLRFGVVYSAWIHQNGTECPLGTATEQLAKLLEAPCSRFLCALRMELANEDQPDPYVTLAAAAQLETLRQLEVNDQRTTVFRRGELIDPLWDAAPRLEHLQLRGQCPQAHNLNHANLTKLELTTHTMTGELLECLLEHELPKLKELCLHLNPADERNPIEDSVRELVLQLEAPQLRTLRLRQTPYSNLITSLLPESAILSQLELLDLSSGSLTDDGAQSILENKRAYSHLKQIDLRHNWLVESPRSLENFGTEILISDQHPWENLRLRR